ncbi:2OG-Fe(II) oxygenase [Oleiagrimonas soli]|uniref:2OG-Fe(II) oxygenase n=1 Tax=Oleiagrimonas soli TaxID=1543381 RepID=A0A099CVQ3_9GAMM|nr:2OG-Fe(II) oxygenase [Oleiagrimonas soli]KGI77766.1 2OG-Fe(II) oxygenase [Oleiagrimonas soli]MBB6183914.1 SM-20-related protein [Oleiagrimonas soli]
MGTMPLEFQPVAEAIERDGWCVCDDLFDPALIEALADECRELDALSRLKPAAVGRGGRRRLAAAVRSDRTHWLDDTFSEAQTAFLARMLSLRDALNRRLLLGLHELEAHYAVYPAGAYYDRHRDRFRDDDARVLSTVLYLNRDWSEADAGHLRLYLPDGTHHDVLPQTGRLALFLSADFDHEVLAPTRPRMSIAGWFRQRDFGVT